MNFHNQVSNQMKKLKKKIANIAIYFENWTTFN